MNKVYGYLVKDMNGEIIGATGDEREAIYIARLAEIDKMLQGRK